MKQSPNAPDTIGTSFISKIDPTLNGAASLVYSSYIGGTNGTSLSGLGDFGNGIAADASGNAYVVGITYSSPGAALADFPVTANAFQSTLNTPNGNAFLTRIDTTQSGAASLIYSTYLGGAGANDATLGYGETAFGVAVDAASNAYIVGTTSSTDFPKTANAFSTSVPTNNSKGTAFVARIDTTKSGAASLIYSTYLGGEVLDEGFGIGLGPNSPNNVPLAYVTGVTESLAFPTVPAGAFQKNNPAAGNAGDSAAFVSLIDTGGTGSTSLTYSTFLGGSVNTTGDGIRADAQGNAYVGGGTASLNFPVTAGAFEPVFPAGATGAGFLSKLNPGGNGAADLVYSTFFGGSGANGNPDQVYAVAIDTATPANAYITGQTFSTAATFPIFPAGAFQKTLNGTSDAFIAKLTPIPTLVVSPTSLNFGTITIPNTSAAQMVTLTNNTNATIAFTSATFTNGTPAAATTDYAVSANTCAAGIPAGVAPANQCTVSVTFKPSVVGAETATLLLTDGDSTSPQSVSLTGTGAAAVAPGVGLAPTPLPFGGEMLTTTSAAQPVTLTNTGNGALTINSIAASGDFAETSTGATACPIAPATLAAGKNCVINVTFAPTALNARAGNLTVTDNAAGSPHIVPLTGTGWDFSLAGPAQAPPAITSTAPGNFNITMTPLGGFNQNVTLTCAVTPAAADATCTVASPVKAADGVTVQNAAVTVTTTALMVPPGSVPTPPISMRQVVPVILALLLLLLLPRTKRLPVRLGMAGAMLLLVILAGCSGPGKPPTQPIPAVLTITGTTSGTPPGVVNHQAIVNLTIN